MVTYENHLMAQDLSATQRAIVESELGGSASAGNMCSLAGQLSRLLWAFTVSGSVVDPTLEIQADDNVLADKVIRVFAARYLVAILVLWSLSQVIG